LRWLIIYRVSLSHPKIKWKPSEQKSWK
jgi:hypothetical protein